MDLGKITKVHNDLLNQQVTQVGNKRKVMDNILNLNKSRTDILKMQLIKLSLVYSLIFLIFTTFNILLLDIVKPKQVLTNVLSYERQINDLSSNIKGNLNYSLKKVKKWAKKP